MKCAIFLADGFEECEGLITVDMLRRADLEIDTVSVKKERDVLSSHKVTILADKILDEIDPKTYDVLILPGGKLGTENLNKEKGLKKALVEHYESGRLTCAICAAPSILGKLGILKDKNYTCFPSFYSESYGGNYQQELAVTDDNLITGRGMGATIEFARQIILYLTDEETLKKVEYGMQYEHSFRNN